MAQLSWAANHDVDMARRFARQHIVSVPVSVHYLGSRFCLLVVNLLGELPDQCCIYFLKSRVAKSVWRKEKVAPTCGSISVAQGKPHNHPKIVISLTTYRIEKVQPQRHRQDPQCG